MKKVALGQHLNVIMEAVDKIAEAIGHGPRVKERVNIIRDQVVLLALDAGLPVQPVPEKKSDGESERRPGEAG